VLRPLLFFAACFFAPAASIASTSDFLRGDVSADVTLLANPLKFYNYTIENGFMSDLHHHDGKLYLTHGNSASGDVFHILYADVETGTPGREGDGIFNEEHITRIRQRGDDLYVHSYDAWNGAQYYYKPGGGVWSKIRVNGGGDHMRDTIYFGGSVWVSFSRSSFPNMLKAPDTAPSGAFSPVTQTAPSGWDGATLMEAFFEHGGKLFATSGSRDNFALYYDPAAPGLGWRVAHQTYAAAIGTPNMPAIPTIFGTPPILDPVESDGMLLFSALYKNATSPTSVNMGLYVTADFLAGPATAVPLPGIPAEALIRQQYILKREGKLFVVSMADPYSTGSKLTRVWIHQATNRSNLASAASWTPLACFEKNVFLGSFSTTSRHSPVEFVDGSFYITETYSGTTSNSNSIANGAGSIWEAPVVPLEAGGPLYGAWSAGIDWGAIPIHDREVSDDPEGDGRTNFMEFALGFSPTTPDGQPYPVLTSEPRPDGSVVVTLRYPKAVPQLTYSIKRSTDLAIWTATGVGAETASAMPGLWERTCTVPAGTDRLFFRLEVSGD